MNDAIAHIEQARELVRQASIELSQATTAVATDPDAWGILAEQLVKSQHEARELHQISGLIIDHIRDCQRRTQAGGS